MKKLLFFIIAFTIVGLSLVPNACKHEPLIVPGNPQDTTTHHPQDTVPPIPVDSADYTGHPCSADTVYFQNTILPLLVSQCAKSGCHDAISHVEGINTTDYAHIIQRIKAFSPTQSSLYKSIVQTGGDRMPPAPSPAWTTDQVNLLKKWIQQGALNNSCNENYGGCDTTGVTYTKFIQPVIANQCLGCHATASTGGGTLLNTYDQVKASALTGKLYGDIAYQSGFNPMPKGGAQMSPCFQKKFQAWIKAGMKQ
jgi:hypothetical protein